MGTMGAEILLAITEWMPNDLVSSYKSSLPLEFEGQDKAYRKVFRRSYLEFFKVKRNQRGGNLLDVDAGNHSMQKNPEVIDGTVYWFKPLYPLSY